MGHTTYACCVEGCGAVICFDPTVEQRLRRTHETWSCPFGHRQHFSGKTVEERRIGELEATLRIVERQLVAAQERALWCPWSGCEFRASNTTTSLHMHLVRAHGMPTLGMVRSEAS